MRAAARVWDYATPFCFFLVSVAYKLAWTAISSLLSQFSRDYGPEILLQLNVAYFFPSIPVLILQTVCNDAVDKRIGLGKAAAIRFSLGLGGLAYLTYHFPTFAVSHTGLLVTTVLVGTTYGVAFGTSYQLAARFPPINTVALTTGFVSSGPVVLLLDVLLKRGSPYYTAAGLQQLFHWVSLQTLAGLLAAYCLLACNQRLLRLQQAQRMEVRLLQPAAGGKEGAFGRSKLLSRRTGDYSGAFGSSGSMRQRSETSDAHNDPRSNAPHSHSYANDHGASNNGYHAVLMMDALESSPHHSHHDALSSSPLGLGGGFGGGHHQTLMGPAGGGGFGAHAHNHRAGGSGSYQEANADDSKAAKRDVPFTLLAWRISPAALSIFLSVGTSMLVFPFFTYVHSTGLFGDKLAEVLFYVRLSGDIAGRLVPRRLQASTVKGVVFWALVKTALTPVVLASIFRPEALLGDAGAMVTVAAFWLLSGYVNTCSYLVAPMLVPASQKTRASGLMTVAFQSSCFIALLAAYVLQTAQVEAAVA